MFTKIRMFNVVLFLILLGQIYAFATAPSAQAQTAAFLKRPYYGGGTGGVAWNAVFDHKCPDYNASTGCSQASGGVGVLLRYDGQSFTSCTNGGTCYDGHSGYDLNLVYQPVVASAPGTITYSGWYDNANHESAFGLYIILQHSPSFPTHRTIYGHLSMVRFPSNWNVTGYWQIGTSGNTGNSTGAHLHFELQFNTANGWKTKDMYGWSGSGTDPWQASSYGGVVSEWLWLPYPQREQTPPTYIGDYILDNDDGTYPNNSVLGCNAGTGAGNCPYWYLVNDANGYQGDLRYTLPNGTTPDYWAKWITPNLPTTAQYEVQAFVPYWDASNRAHAVRYEVVSAGATNVVVVDQHEVNPGTWISLGRYNFNAGSTNYVKVTDAAYVGGYTDPANTTKKILVDAMRWRRVQ